MPEPGKAQNRRFNFSSFSRVPAESSSPAAAGVSVGTALLIGAVMLSLGGLTGWGLRAPGDGRGNLASVGLPAPAREPERAEMDGGRARNVMLAKLDVESYEAQVEQAQDALTTAKSALAALQLESAAAIASSRAKQDMAQKTLARVSELRQRGATTQDELDNAQMQFKIASADLNTAQSKLLCVKTLESMVAQRQSDVKANQAKLKVAQAELEIARSR